MKNFKFRLQNFLKIKEHEEKIALNEVLRQENRVSALQDKIDHFVLIQKENREKMNTAGAKNGSSMSDLLLVDEFLRASTKKIEFLNKDLDNEIKILEKLRLKYLEAKKELKVIEKVKDKKRNEFKVEVQKRDAHMTTEVAAQLYNRGRVKHG